ncbi:uncharacterized protein C8Q71DRAFT_598878 [Rhodofomes roseus]|uniref:T6SS Phospholipase effector Tle1-like catalytic domain-containing protein n=1 Tax=Rhodofomes roseus TaxID=34475 RepID=A0ABQ8KHR1_9APHY|nr:uncharacterized protein C8Q71DRAFT_598878 [Rhodofomes roseus]KAH9837370.1 hypothetical protein C8Q71DRAFT_598878 [Rhodofomes roseus]
MSNACSVSPSPTNVDFPSTPNDRDVIPPTSKQTPRTLVLCFDGTGDQFDTDNSNVILFFSMLMKDNPEEQMVYYQSGIGTYTIPEIATPLYAGISKTLDEMIAWNLNAHVMGGYEFLMSNYRAGDKICLFGFSRGAYTARALAGMIHKVGLLPRSNHQQVPFAYHMFTRDDEWGWRQSTEFKKTFSMDIDIEFIGVWDTVRSVGLIPHTLPFTSSNSAIKIFRHALSLDEHRAKFKANHYQWPTELELKQGVQPGQMPKAGQRQASGWGKSAKDAKGRKPGQRRSSSQEEMRHEQEFSAADGHNAVTNVKEVWFAGCHTDVGGGSVENTSRHNLARIPLRWMIRECFLTGIGVRFHSELLRNVGLDPDALSKNAPRPPPLFAEPGSPLIRPRHARGRSDVTLVDGEDHGPRLSEEQEDLIDALCPIFDELKISRLWWILEVIPLVHRVRDKMYGWVDKWITNWGRGRTVPDDAVFNVHRSVEIRLRAGRDGLLEGAAYKPNAIIPHGLKMNFVD